MTAAKRAQFQHLQALDDAIDFRCARAVAPCSDCGPDDASRCDEHARDLELIVAYHRTAASLIAELEADRSRTVLARANR